MDDLFATPTPIPPTATLMPTPTIDWFPASPTPSPQVILTHPPTPEMRPDVGGILFRDDFSNAAAWDLAATDSGSAGIADNRLTLAAQSEFYMLSLRRATSLDNFYAEITATPNLCRAEDSYGIVIRANAIAYYRFALSCNGHISAERVRGRSREWLQEPVPSGDAPIGVGEVRIGVWARGTELRVFLNGRYQFSVANPTYTSGSLGVFVNAAGSNPVVVAFADLVVRELR